MPEVIQVTVNTKTVDLFRFMIFHAYSKLSGLLTFVFGIVSLILLPVALFLWKDNFVAIVLLMVVIIYLVMTPLNMLSQSKRQVISNPVFKNPITFHMSEEIFEVQQYTGTARLFWNQLIMIKKTPYDYLFYVNKDQAFVMPKKSVNPEDIQELDKIIDHVKKEIPATLEVKIKEKLSTKKDGRRNDFEKQLHDIASKDMDNNIEREEIESDDDEGEIEEKL